MRPLVIGATAVVIALAAACGGGQVNGERRTDDPQTLGDLLHVPPDDCGFTGDRRLDLTALENAGTVRRQIDEITSAVKGLRGLDVTARIRPTILSPPAFRRRLRAHIERNIPLEDVEIGSRVLVALGAIPPGFDLVDALVGSTVAETVGFYDPVADTILVARSGGDALDEFDFETLAHEIEHAMTDAAFGLADPEDATGWGDRHLAFSALAEGSATITELRFVGTLFGTRELRHIFDDRETLKAYAELGEGLTPYLQEMVLFPYLEGIGFVCELYAEGGWDAVDRAYRSPPTSSAEILFPERYIAGRRPQRPPKLGNLAKPWRPHRTISGQFGAADLVALFEAPAGKRDRALDDALSRARAWGGGRIEVWTRAHDVAFGISLVEHDGRGDLCDSVNEWYARAFPRARRRANESLTFFGDARQQATIKCTNGSVTIGVAPTAAVARRLALSGS